MADQKNAVPSTEGTTRWIVEQTKINVTKVGETAGKKITLSTAGKFLDRDIEIEAPIAVVEDGSIISGAITVDNAKADATTTGFTAAARATNYKVAISGTDGKVTPEFGTAVTVPVDVSTQNLYIPEADLTLDTELTAPAVTTTVTTSTGITQATGTTKYGITVSNAKTNGSVTASVEVSNVGMVDTADNTTTEAKSIVPTVTADQTIYLNESSVANAPTAGVIYEETPVTIVTTDGYLYINEGYNETAKKISLADLVPDPPAVEIGGSDDIRAGKTFIDKDGNFVTGTMADATAMGDTATATITTADIKVNTTQPTSGTEGNDYFKITANGSGNSKVSAAGYIATGALPAATATTDYYVSASTHATTATVEDLTAPSGTYGTAASINSTDYSIEGIKTAKPVSGTYITIDPTITKSSGSVSAASSCTATEGYTKGGTVTGASAVSTIDFDATKGTVSYIEVFTGEYLVG